MGGFTFCCGDMGPVMEAKGTVTNEILEMIEDDPRVCYINADGTGRGGRVQQAQLRYPDRILDVGIQEMNMVTIAAASRRKASCPTCRPSARFSASVRSTRSTTTWLTTTIPSVSSAPTPVCPRAMAPRTTPSSSSAL